MLKENTLQSLQKNCFLTYNFPNTNTPSIQVVNYNKTGFFIDIIAYIDFPFMEESILSGIHLHHGLWTTNSLATIADGSFKYHVCIQHTKKHVCEY